MPRIRFTAKPKLPRDMAHLGYDLGTEVDLSDDQAGRWVRRGVAEIIPDQVKKPAPAVVRPAPAARPASTVEFVPAKPAE